MNLLDSHPHAAHSTGRAPRSCPRIWFVLAYGMLRVRRCSRQRSATWTTSPCWTLTLCASRSMCTRPPLLRLQPECLELPPWTLLTVPYACGVGVCFGETLAFRLIRARNKGLEILCELVSRQSIGLLSAVSRGGEYCSTLWPMSGAFIEFAWFVQVPRSKICIRHCAGTTFAAGEVVTPALIDIVTAESYYSPHVRHARTLLLLECNLRGGAWGIYFKLFA